MRRTMVLALVALSLLIVIGGGCVAGGYDNGSYSDSTYNSGTHTINCPACDGTGVCNMCYGDGKNPLDSNHQLPCTCCRGGGVCPRCHGRGTITF